VREGGGVAASGGGLVPAVAPGVEVRVGAVGRSSISGDYRGGRGGDGWPDSGRRRRARWWGGGAAVAGLEVDDGRGDAGTDVEEARDDTRSTVGGRQTR
jgi:hypothetical protein